MKKFTSLESNIYWTPVNSSYNLRMGTSANHESFFPFPLLFYVVFYVLHAVLKRLRSQQRLHRILALGSDCGRASWGHLFVSALLAGVGSPNRTMSKSSRETLRERPQPAESSERETTASRFGGRMPKDEGDTDPQKRTDNARFFFSCFFPCVFLK